MRYIFYIKVASTLPHNNYVNNAFRRSFCYDTKEATLWIRLERFNKPSELLIVVAHCMAHIANNDDFDDTNGDFIRNLYYGLKSLTTDSFTLRAQPAVLSPSYAEPVNDEVMDSVIDMNLRIGDNPENYQPTDAVTKLREQNKQVTQQFVRQSELGKMKELADVVKEMEEVQHYLSPEKVRVMKQEDEMVMRIRLQKLHESRDLIMRELSLM